MSLCPFLMVLSVIVLAAREVNVPPRVGSNASTDPCNQVGLLSTLSLYEYSWLINLMFLPGLNLPYSSQCPSESAR